ncbi:uncharacterized protein C14orf93 homolog [Rhineura floridana]|uniref:uncharacterized protein C14orf93 homolog n=1 Tax=Rhineura floridana TaxID=261503 RepID=UPI002AC83717|nr:uncharacterized protein C14orf93 homolog [Rhineura floridana]XP_061444683.1 uncharacterized protein C14orf93 homolog [Rhineura floridana]
MSFSATILFSPPNAKEAKCCCCTCKQEPGAQTTTTTPPPPPSPSSTPITVTGTGLAVQSSDQLLHIIYQRVEKAVSLAEVALSLAKANNETLRRLEEEVGALRRGVAPALKTSPLGGPKERQEDNEEEDEEEQEAEGFRNGVQVVIEELRQLGAAAGPPGHLGFSPMQQGPGGLGGGAEESPAVDVSMQRVYATPPSPAPPMPQPLDDPSLSCPEVSPNSITLEDNMRGEPHFSLGFASLPCRSRSMGQKNARRKRDLVLSKLVHNVHNHITNERRFDGSESIKSSWNISVVKFLLEKLKHELVSNHHNYTDKELKGACVAYFLTKRREYRNSLNPFKGLKEKEEKKLRSRRYRLFANRSGVARLLGPEEQRLWQGVTEELMSDEEDSLSEPGVWVARPPRFRATPLTQLCYRLDANSKHGTKANRIYGPPSDRLPSAEAQLLPLHLYNPHFQEEEARAGTPPRPPSHKGFCPDLSSFVEIKVEKDE